MDKKTADLINALDLAYSLALHLPEGVLRSSATASGQLGFIRDTLAAATGQDPKDIQDRYEHYVFLSRNPQLGAKVGA